MLKVEMIVQLARGLAVSEPKVPSNLLRLCLWINERSQGLLSNQITREVQVG